MFGRRNRELSSAKPHPATLRDYSDQDLKSLLDQYEVIDRRLLEGVCAEILRRQLNLEGPR